MNVVLRGMAQAILEEMVGEGYANSKSEAIRLAISSFGQTHFIEAELVDRKLNKIDAEIRTGKRKLLNAGQALGKYAKYLE